MANLLDTGWPRDAVYFIAAVVAVGLYVAERRRMPRRDLWPRYWVISASMIAAMGVARASALGDLIADLGRSEARSTGWYDARHGLQAAAVIGVATVWCISVVLAIWRVPPRRRRYLPHVITWGTIAAFAVVRMVSLHQVDSVLYFRDVAGVRLVAVIELALLSVLTMLELAAALSLGPPSVGSHTAVHGVAEQHH